jgi:ribose 5-phosphate isomerase B
MKIIIGSDHAGFELKEDLKVFLIERGIDFFDAGTYNSNPSDYPEIGAKVARCISSGLYEKGILICATGIGMSIVANRFPGVRGALCNDIFQARMSRRHNDSNCIILGGKVIGKGLARAIVEEWLSTEFEGGRHKRRLAQITGIEKEFIEKGYGSCVETV